MLPVGNKVTKYIQEDTNEPDDANTPFYVNKSGFPIDDKTWERLWKYAGKVCPDAVDQIEEIKNGESLNEIPVASLPALNPQASMPHCLRCIQNYINNLSYNHTGTQLFEIKKGRPLAGLMDKAKEMIRESLPVKCLEAVILAIYLTNSLINIERFPIGFKSVFNGHCYYHVVLGVYHNGNFGALGISRRGDLMDKPLGFKCLYDLIKDYHLAYSKYTHQLKKVRIGGIIPHDMCSQERINWGDSRAQIQRKLDQYGREIKSQFIYSFPFTSKKDLVREHVQLRSKPIVQDILQQQDRETKSANFNRKLESDVSDYHVKV